MRETASNLVFAPEHQCVVLVVGRPPVEQILGVVERASGEPARTGHAIAVDENPVAGLADHARVIPQRAPERVAPIDRPAPQRVIIRRREAVHPRKVGDRRFVDARARRCPELFHR
jgi:hypothetical protein